MNVLNIKEKDILQFLIKNKERFVTSKELAEYLSCSDRTVRNVLKLLDKLMNWKKTIRKLRFQKVMIV